MVTTLVIYGVVVPAVVAGVLMLAAALAAPQPYREVVTNLAAAGGLIAGGLIAFTAQYGAPVWPPVSARDWMVWAAVIGGLAGLFDALVRHAPNRALRWLRFVPAVGLALWLPRSLMAPLVEHTFEGSEAALWTWGGAVALLGIWLSLDLLASRATAFAYAVAAVVLTGGAAGVLVLGSTASLGQLLGAIAASVGGMAAALLLVRKRVPLEVASLTPAVAMSLVVGLLSAHHYAELSLTALWVAALAPLAAALLSLLPRLQAHAAWRGVVQVGAVAAVLAIAAATADRPAAEKQAEADPYDYGYGYEDEPANDSAPDDPYGPTQGSGGYDYDAMKDWQPPSPD